MAITNLPWHETAPVGTQGVQLVRDYYQEHGQSTWVLDYRYHSADLLVVDDGLERVLEVKTSRNPGDWDSFFLETLPDPAKPWKLPEWRQEDCEADYFVQVDLLNKRAYFYDCQSLRTWTLDNLELARTAKHAGSQGIKVPWTHEPAGYLYSVDL